MMNEASTPKGHKRSLPGCPADSFRITNWWHRMIEVISEPVLRGRHPIEARSPRRRLRPAGIPAKPGKRLCQTPLAERLRLNAAKLHAHAKRHHDQRITTPETTP